MAIVSKRGMDESKRLAYDPSGESYFKHAFSHAAIGLALVGLDGRFSYVNPAYLQITGYSERELKRHTIADLMLPEDAEANAVLRNKMLAGKIPGYVIEKRYKRRDGSLIWVKSSVSLAVDNEGNPIRIVGITEDIDERRKAEDALRKSEARFRFMAESMPPKVFTADAKGVITYLSPQWILYTGRASVRMEPREWSQTIHPDDRDANVKAWIHAIETGESFYFEHRLKARDGSYRWHVSRAFALRNDNGNIVEWIGSDTDVEELRQNRELEMRFRIIAEQREELISTNRLKDDFIMLASHQLRTPATGVKQYIGMLLQGYSDAITEDQRGLLQSAFDSNERQLRTVNDLLRVARIDAGHVSVTKQSCDLVKFVENIVIEQQSVFVGRRQKVIFEPYNGVLMAEIDVDLMRVVFESLLDNASKYSPVGRTTVVAVRKDRVSLTVSVTDNGVGIRKKDQAQLFQKFSRLANPLSEADTGTGLGLYWAKKITELHGGTLQAVSHFKKGSTFSVRLPIMRIEPA